MSPTGERNSVYNFEKEKNRIKLPESLLRQQDLKCRDKNITRIQKLQVGNILEIP